MGGCTFIDDMLQGSGASQQLHYIEPDHLGTPRAIIDGSRNVAIWEWKPTGEAFGATPPNQDPDQDGILFIFDLRFPGQRYDATTGLNYNYFRDYDADTGRYVESDPIGQAGGMSTYGYAFGIPTTMYDSTGLAAQRREGLRPDEPVPDGTIFCGDWGRINIWLNESAFRSWEKECGIADCAKEHEASHVRDAMASNPGVCRNFLIFPARGLVTFPRKADGIYVHPEYFRSELRAYAAELRCLSGKLRNQPCTKPYCNGVIKDRINFIVNSILPTVYDHTYPNGLD